ncbi:chitobiase/beta-hexosaminidase C-terminal domain-containing protein [Prevotella communis]|uniref:chitobiase/beta-hexosaminidase C-terminal domain-containing protein n=1 Tax=Prevotella communis TaxID=2913614 RepID=UPI001EDB61D0|nr:chitobiase/beta-hexosaminidase C-terminal domain-containing protein [Prevotella communis]UKK67663.1 chitobiase/beta-hexosaminidase C-terminal domain-containing protein [Prevotella communis]UKK70190.1 chitobiase/beta-hexosaminidase C-terminal domain-containing protein [Prevotella communis]
MKHFNLLKTTLLLCALIVGSLSGWADKVTDYNNIVSGKKYYIGATTGGKDYYLSVNGSSTTNSIAGTAVSDKASAAIFTFSGSGTSWTIQFESGNYLSLKDSKDNGKVQVVSSASTFTASNESSKIRLSKGNFSIQKNNSGTQFGSYGNTQTDIWLEEAAAASPLASIALSGSYPTSFNEGDAFSHEGMTVTASYEDLSTKNVTSSATFSGYDMSSVGNQEVTVSYTEGDITKTAKYGIVVNALPKYTVSFSDGGSVTQASYGAKVTLPTRSAISSYTFAGWSETNIPDETTTTPTIIPAGDYTPTADITLYPVYSKTEGASGVQNKTASVTISDYASAKGWTSGTKYTTIEADENVTIEGASNGNNSKFYNTSTPHNWRFYATDNGSFTITTSNGVLTSATITYTGNKLKYNNNDVTSATPISVSGTSATFVVSGSSSNSQVSAIEVNYTIGNQGTTYYWSAPVAATVERPEITLAANPFTFSTTATITCATNGADIKYSYDGTNWSDYSAPLTITETKTIYAKAVLNSDESQIASVTATKNLVEPTVTIDATGITNTNVFAGTDAGSLSASVTYNDAPVEGAVVTWSVDNDKIATINATTGAVTLVDKGTVTFTATYAGNSDFSEKTATYEMTVINNDPNAPGTEGNPYTVAQARAAIDAGEGVTDVYVAGIVCEGGSTLSSGSMNYWISDDGTETDKFEIYRGKGLNGANFTSVNDVKIGDVVVVYGDIKLYGSTYEFNTGSRLVTHKAKVLNPTFSPVAGVVAAGTTVAISTTTEGATIYYTTDGTDPTTGSGVYSAPITINVTTTIKAIAVKDGFPNSDVVEASYTVAAPVATPTFSLAEGTYTSIQTVTISTDTEEADIYYTIDGSEPTTSSNKYSAPISVDETMNIKAIAVKDGMANSAVASATYTINLPDYAELPFSFNSGKDDIASIIGLTQSGLGSDYNTSPKLKFDGTGDYLVLKINEIPGILSFDIKGNTFSGGTFKVQTSVDGENYSDLSAYSDLGDTQSEKFDLSADVRYIKWIYTTKSSGNVGLGNIKLTNTKEIAISAAGWATYCSSAPLDFTNVTTLTAYTASKYGSAVKFNKVTGKVPANTGLLVRGETANVPVCASAEAVSNLLVGVTTDTPKDAGTIFVLMKGSKGIGFYKNTNDFTLRANSAYLRAEDVEGSTARAFIALDDETTGIADVKAVKEDAEGMFDLQGRKIAKPTKGLYIVNGKKIVVK